ncbi:Sec-independent protein translocase subunit TatA [Streptomyces sp. NPDC048191]|uniref:Sec-independent protein translocase subunit TatA n=1 Tax=Streptomyces sp. NPDC048191 TaxID=3155484 RepID=UPI003400CDFD
MLRNGLEPWHLLIVAVVFLLLFGSRKLPDTARALGKSMRILKSEAKAMKDENGTPGTTGTPVVEPSEVLTADDVHAAAHTGTATAHTGTAATGAGTGTADAGTATAGARTVTEPASPAEAPVSAG